MLLTGDHIVILITGAGGTCGRELLQQLSAAGIPLRAGYSTAARAETARSNGINAVHADFRRPETLATALRGAGALFLLSGWSPDQGRMESNVVREAARAGVHHIVKLSVWDAAGEGFSFARIHRPVEKEIEDSGVQWTFLRPNGFMQNLSNFHSIAIRGRSTLFMPSIDVPISHVDVRDVAHAAAAALTQPGHEGRIYELSGPEPLTYRRMASILAGVLGRAISCVEVTPDQTRAQMLQDGVPAAYAEAVIDLTRYYSEGRAARVSPDIRRITGRDPLPFERFARDHAGAFR